MPNDIPLSNPLTAAPILTPTKEALFQLIYRQRTNPYPLNKQFNSSGTLQEIIQRCKRHCELMNYIFVRVQPFMSSLEDDERRNSIGG